MKPANVKTSIRLTELDRELLHLLAEKLDRRPGDALRYALREEGRRRGLWPLPCENDDRRD